MLFFFVEFSRSFSLNWTCFLISTAPSRKHGLVASHQFLLLCSTGGKSNGSCGVDHEKLGKEAMSYLSLRGHFLVTSNSNPPTRVGVHSFFSYVASKILSQGAHPKSPVQNPKSKIPKIQNPKSKIPKIQNPKSPKSKIPKFQNPNFAHKDLLYNVPKIQNPKSPKSRKSKIQNPQNPKCKIQNPQNPKSKIPKIQNPKSPQSKIQNPQNPKNPKSKIPKIQNPKSPNSKIQAFLAGFWGFWGFWSLDFGDLGFWILDLGFRPQNPKSKLPKIQNPKSPKSKIPKIQNPQNPKSKIPKIQNPPPKSKIWGIGGLT